jgi:periplasmic protein CpxP/Spy
MWAAAAGVSGAFRVGVRLTRLSLSGATIAGALVAASAGWAQSPGLPRAPLPIPEAPRPPPPPSAIAVPAPPGLPVARQAAIDRRIDALHAQLGITKAETSLWAAFAHAIRAAALDTAVLSGQRADATGTMSAVDNLRDYARITRANADDAERLATSFERLYESLSPAQKRTADAIFRKPLESPAAPVHR